jgi:hypothetical protein
MNGPQSQVPTLISQNFNSQLNQNQRERERERERGEAERERAGQRERERNEIIRDSLLHLRGKGGAKKIFIRF